MRALAIDLGTTACKASVVAIDGRLIGSGVCRLVTEFGDGEVAEQDAEQVWQAALTASRAAIAEAGGGAGIALVGVASQWSSLVAVDAGGRPVSPLVMTRALASSDTAADRWRDVHGFLPSTSLGHLLRLQSDPSVHAAAAAYLEPMDYLNARLTGRVVATANTAMPLALTDNRHLGQVVWSDELIELAGVDRRRLPELVASPSVIGTVLPDVAGLLGISDVARVVTGANDSIAAAVGSGALEPGVGTVMLGTTSVLVAHQAGRHVDTDRFIVTMPSALGDRYYVVAEAGLGGKLLELAVGQALGAGDEGPPDAAIAAAIELAGSTQPGAGGVLFLPWVIGSMSPAPDRRQRGALLGVSMATTAADVVRAVLEGVALQMRWLVAEVESATATSLPSLRFTGGGAQSTVWAQIMADVLRRPIEQVAEPRHANARGAALLGFVAAGALALDDLAELVPIAARFEPTPGLDALYAERLDVIRQLHTTLAEPVSRLDPRRHAAPAAT
jgi:xylulokinase